jgi:hypothetical protein
MAGEPTSIADIFRPQPPPPVGYLPAKAPAHGLRIGIIIGFVVVQAFLLLQTYLNSPLLPGNWSGFQFQFTFYLMLDVLALGMIAFWPRVIKNWEKIRIQPNGFVGFAFTYALFGLAMWGIMIGYLSLTGSAVQPVLDDTARLQQFVFIALFVGPTEELFFRVALPPYTGWVLGSCVLFGLFHALAYSTGTGAFTGIALLIQMMLAMAWGGFFWFLYSRWGYGASVSAHTIFDLAVGGIITAGIAGLAGLFVFPL